MKYAAYGNYKSSASEWLGLVPSHWHVDRLKWSTAGCYNGVWGDEPNEIDDLICVRVADFDRDRFVVVSNPPTVRAIETAQRRNRILQKNDLLIEKSGGGEKQLVGCVVQFSENFPAVCSNFVARLPVSSGCDPRYLTYLHSAIYAARLNYPAIKQTTGIQNLDSGEYLNILAAYPPLDEQQIIARFLDAKTAQIDELIAKKRLLIDKLKEKRQALIARTVTHGLPPEAAKAAGLEPNPNPEMKDSGVDFLGVVPKTWNVVRLKHVLNAKKGAIKTGPFGSQLHGSEMLESEIKVFNQRTVIDRDISSGDNYISLEKFEELKSFEVFPGDLLVTTRGTIGRCMVVPDGAEKGILHPCLMRLQLNKIHITDRYLELLIEESGYVIDQLRLMSNATTIEVIYSESLKEVWLAVPPLNEQCKIIEYLDRGASKLDALVERTVLAIARLTEYRQALITSAVTGKIDVREVV